MSHEKKGHKDKEETLNEEDMDIDLNYSQTHLDDFLKS